MQHLNSKKSYVILKTLSIILKKEREKQNKSIRILADEFDIQKSLISRLENEINEPKLISLWTLSEALGVPLSRIINSVEKSLPTDFTLIEK